MSSIKIDSEIQVSRVRLILTSSPQLDRPQARWSIRAAVRVSTGVRGYPQIISIRAAWTDHPLSHWQVRFILRILPLWRVTPRLFGLALGILSFPARWRFEPSP